MNGTIAEFDLFLDESGQFLEMTGQVPPGRRFPSQIVGVLASRNELTAAAAEEVLRAGHVSANLTLEREFHAKDLHGQSFNTLVLTVAQETTRRSWQPVRLMNREGVGYGDQAATYVHMVAELLLRIFERKLRDSPKGVSFRLTCARYMAQDGAFQVMSEEYLRRLREYAAFAAVRRGLSTVYPLLKIQGFEIVSGKFRRELQLCDLLSNASHDDFSKLNGDAKDELQKAFGKYDFTMTVQELADRVDAHLEDGLLGQALWAIAEQMSSGGDWPRGSKQQLETILDRLATLGAPGRRPNLEVLANWVSQLVQVEREIELGPRIAEWLLKHVDAPLRKRLDKDGLVSLDWFTYTLHQLRLTAANHRGDLVTARSACLEMDSLLQNLAGQWENVPVIMEGVVAQAVHLTDCFEHEAAATRMRLVAGYYGDLAGLFADALPGLFPKRVRSEMRGKALGTWLQTEVFAGLRDPARLANARAISEQAIEEFPSPDDKKRQYQYRCQLETYAGELVEARRYLALSLDLAEDASHQLVADAIMALPLFPQGFALLHWFRLGSATFRFNDSAERAGFLEALQRTKLGECTWASAPKLHYPAHGIRRQLANIWASDNEADKAMSTLSALAGLDTGGKEGVLMSLIIAAAQSEASVLLWDKHRTSSRRLLDNLSKTEPGLLQRLDVLLMRLGADAKSAPTTSGTLTALPPDPFATLRQLCEEWKTTTEGVIRVIETVTPNQLIPLAWRVPY